MKTLSRSPALQTRPLLMGNLFLAPWYKPSTNKMQTKLLEYFISCGWDGRKHAKKLIRECVSRGDVEGLQFLVNHNLANIKDSDYCAVAGAAGQLEALKWLREVQRCPWDPSEVYQEASENVQLHIMQYVELKAGAGTRDVGSCSQYGMPW